MPTITLLPTFSMPVLPWHDYHPCFGPMSSQLLHPSGKPQLLRWTSPRGSRKPQLLRWTSPRGGRICRPARHPWTGTKHVQYRVEEMIHPRLGYGFTCPFIPYIPKPSWLRTLLDLVNLMGLEVCDEGMGQC